MARIAQLPDGTELEFPDDTPDDVMDRTVRSHLSVRQAGVPDFSNVTTGATAGPGREFIPAAEKKRPTANDSDFARMISGRPRERSIGESVVRELGLGARGLIRSGYGLSGMLGGDLVGNIEANVRGLPVRTSDQHANALADWLGLPKPETASERIGGDITSAVGMGGGFIGAGRQLATRAPGLAQKVGEAMASRPGLQLTSAVTGSGAASGTREAGGGTGAQIAAGLAGGLSPAVAQTSSSAAVRALGRGGEAGRQRVAQSLEDFGAVGTTPSVGQATGSRARQGVESLLAGGPTSGGVMSRFAERQAEQIGEGLQTRGSALSPAAGGEKAGRAVEKGVKTFAGNVRAVRNALYWQADQRIPAGTTLPLTRTQQTLADLTTPNLAAPNTTGALINPKIRTLADNIAADLASPQNAGGLPFQTVRDIRTRIGEALSDFSLSTDKPTAEYKRLYAALSQDLEEAARRAGPDAQQAMSRANNYFKVSAERLEQLERVVNKAGGPEAVYSAAMSGTRDGATTLRAVLQSLPKDGQRALTGAVVKRMGIANPGAQDATGELFSAQTFLTNWNKLSPEAKRALFDRHGQNFAANMDKVARVASNIREGSKVFANPSGTTNRAAAYGYYGSLAASILSGQGPLAAGLVAGGAGSNLLARAMTNPAFVRWLAKSTEIPVSALPQQLIVLQGIGAYDPEVAEIAEALKQAQGQPESAGTNQ